MATIDRRQGKYRVQIRRQNSPLLSKTFTLKKDAETWARQKELEIERGDLPQDQRKQLKGLTLSNLVERYRDEVSVKKKGAKNEKYWLEAFLRHDICKKPLGDVTTADFAKYRDERLKAVTPLSLKRELAIIHNLYKIAKKEWLYPLKNNPLDDLELKCVPVRRDRRLQDGELELLIEDAKKRRNPLILPIVLFAIDTGMRRSEILAMDWKNLDLKNKTLLISDTKNGQCS